MPVVGVISAGSRSGFEDLLARFRAGLREFGYVEGQNVAIDYHYADNQYDRLPALAADLARRQVALIYAGVGSSLAAKGANSTIPHAFSAGTIGQDGLWRGLDRPGSSAAGVVCDTAQLAATRGK
jgi:putative ABC transport system substrate-binding protein